MGLFNDIKNSIKEKEAALNAECDALIQRMETSLSEAGNMLKNSTEFVDLRDAESWKSKHSVLVKQCQEGFGLKFRFAKNHSELSSMSSKVQELDSGIVSRFKEHNESVARYLKEYGRAILGDVEGRQLDEQQLFCIVKEAHNHLVIAGAGTGKTTTVVGRIKYLLKSGACNPEDILVLSFTNASATEMSERINKETGSKIYALTFHKLGLNIIRDADGIMPKITTLQMRNFIKSNLADLMKNPKYLRLLNSYLINNRVLEKSEFEFSSNAEYEEYLLSNPPKTLKGEIVKSYGEMEIANLLLASNVNYIYEHPYQIDTRTSEYGQYNPDFYLPDYGIYVEYFGVDKNGEVPSYFAAKEGKTPTQTYQEGMEWKRTLHRDNGTIMIECYAYEKFEDALRPNLLKKLAECGVDARPMTPEELWEMMSAEDASILDGIYELFETLINLLRSNRYSIADLDRLAQGIPNYSTNQKLILLLEPIFNAYDEYLKKTGEIDFNDMINKASDYIQSGKFANPYKYVIVDEYQDISKARFNLLKELRDSADYNLFCVGDDWQSIYRFAGSDIGYILNFEKFWGLTQSSKIETTYRFTKSLIEISGRFIMRNPAQIKKAIKGQNNDEQFALGEIQGFTEANAIDFMAEKLRDLPQNSTVFFIGRYSFDIRMLDTCRDFSYRYDNQSSVVRVTCRFRRDLDIQFITAHKSKGLQADYVFILNNKSSRMGFPSKIQDSPLIGLLLDNSEDYPYAEERRLFYVALTRAKKKTFLVTLKGKESEFAMELKTQYEDEIKKERFTCPLCGGRLVKRSGKYGEFWGCSNYSSTGCKYIRNIKSSNKPAE